jgi:F-type H+-transporting ATPase subunit delta
VSRVANRYSKALFEMALGQNKLDVVEKDMNGIRSLLDDSTDFRQLVENPLIQARSKERLLGELFEGRVDALTRNFLVLLTQKKRTENLPEIIVRFFQRVDQHRGVVKGEIYSAHPLSEDQVAKIRTRMDGLTGKKVELDSKVDADLIGGFVVKLNDTVYDLSVKGHLDRLREQLVFG